jgi:hypothetical protein
MQIRSVRAFTRAVFAALVTVSLASGARPAAAQEIMSSVSASHMEKILTGMGIDFEKKNDTAWRLDLDGKKVLLIMGNDYADDDSNPVLESDLDFAGGTTDDIIVAWVKLYGAQVKSYVKYLSNL